jgi:SpoVK/Ycf46/Vps4 family AAA+-type ATPase
MVFTGNPGTAKTTVARLLAEILRDEKILPSGKFVEAGRADLVGQFVGHTAPLVKRKFKEAKGGILFIDEAYSLCDDNMNSFGDEAINTIVQEMENNREDTIVIFAGYPEPMREFLERNPGMTSRIAFKLHFEDYTVDELCDITKLMVKNKEMSITEEALAKLREQYEAVYQRNDYGNGRYVRKVLEEAEMNLAERLLHLDENEITTELVTTIEECDIPELEEDRSETKSHIGFMV